MDINAQQFWSSKLKVESTMDLEDGIEQTVISNVNRNDTATTFNGVTTGSSAPSGTKSVTAGEHWHRTGTLSGAPDERDLIYNSSAGDWVAPTDSVFATAAPSWTQTGLRWYDTTNFIARRYKGASFDVSGLAGWHSAQDGYELWKNLSGAAVTPGTVVTADATVSYREFIYPQAPKDGNVVGVVAETISSTSNGLIATVASGLTVLVNVNTATHTVSKGDGLVCNAAGSGDARSVGSIDFKNPAATASGLSYGVPYGCFARAMEAVALGTSGAPIKAQLLGRVGEGRVVYFPEDEVASIGDTGFEAADFTTGVNWQELNLLSTPSGDDVISDSGSLKHIPILGAYFNFRWVLTDSAGVGDPNLWAEVQFSKNASDVITRAFAGDTVPGAGDKARRHVTAFAPTSGGGAYTGLGNLVQYNLQKGAVSVTVDATTMWSIVGYVY